jgi:hypothetical protein
VAPSFAAAAVLELQPPLELEPPPPPDAVVAGAEKTLKVPDVVMSCYWAAMGRRAQLN